MSQQNVRGLPSMVADVVIAAYLAVQLKAGGGKVVELNADEAEPFGIVQPGETPKAGGRATVALWQRGRTYKVTASEAIADGASVYAAASGKFEATGTIVMGTALEAASGDGSIIEVRPA